MSTNCKIIDRIESKKNVKTGGIMRESKEARNFTKMFAKCRCGM
jgi:hypothetical protein